ncbi:hypothetical protein AD953_05960 [Acetobacter malorum]|uniref:Uncharacterized protein n=1 Tax=Acetobacter malorum TaxID=178901 RepID=A0A149V6X7_9PROT|nr:hypothetical protein [Acetobacter malorum]KXV75895.1 hypothetical protein AD953_05960 [Acetobacter malorum]
MLPTQANGPVGQLDNGCTYHVERNSFDFVLVEKRKSAPANAERRMPYTFTAEHKSVSILQDMHEGVITASPAELRQEQAEDVVSYIAEHFIQQKPTILNAIKLKEEVEKLIGCMVTELRPNTGTPGMNTEEGAPVVFNANNAEGG